MICRACQHEHSPLLDCNRAQRIRGLGIVSVTIPVTSAARVTAPVTSGRDVVTSPVTPGCALVLVDGPAAAAAYREAERRGLSPAGWVSSLILAAANGPKSSADRMRDMRARKKDGT